MSLLDILADFAPEPELPPLLVASLLEARPVTAADIMKASGHRGGLVPADPLFCPAVPVKRD